MLVITGFIQATEGTRTPVGRWASRSPFLWPVQMAIVVLLAVCAIDRLLIRAGRLFVRRTAQPLSSRVNQNLAVEIKPLQPRHAPCADRTRAGPTIRWWSPASTIMPAAHNRAA